MTAVQSAYRWVRLGDVVGATKAPSRIRLDGEIAFISMARLPTCGLYADSFDLVMSRQIRSGTRVEDGDLLLAKITPCLENGKQGIVRDLPSGVGMATTEILRLRGSECLDIEYLAHVLRASAIRGRLAGLMEGTTGRRRLPRAALDQLEIPLPPVSDQRAIARVLSTIQRAREATDKMAGTLARVGGSMFSQFRGAEERLPAQIVPLGDFDVEISTGPFGSQLHAEDYVEVGTPIVNPTHLRHNGISDEAVPRVDDSNAERLARHALREGDILVPRRGDFSRYAWINARQTGWLCGTGCIVLRLRDERLDSRFLAIYFGMKEAQRHIADHATGSIMPNLNGRVLRDLPIWLPSLADQHRIVLAYEVWERCVAAQTAKIGALEGLSTSALLELISGQRTPA